MYKFTDTTVRAFENKGLTTSANGMTLENEIEGFQTLSIRGREVISNVLSKLEDVEGRDGAIVTSSRLPSRILEVSYRLVGKDKRKYKHAFSRLNTILRAKIGEDIPYTFSDEQDAVYYGQLAEMEEIPEGANGVVSRFTIYCQDPYKYGRVVEVKGNPATIGFQSSYATVPEEISFTLSANTNNIKITNLATGRKIVLNGDYKAEDKVVIKIKAEENQVMVGGRNSMADLAFEGDFGAFKVNPLDEVIVSPPSDITLKIRRRWL